MSPTPGAPDFSSRYEQEPRVLGPSSPPPSPATAPRPPAVPPAGRGATAAAGPGFGGFQESRDLQRRSIPFSASFFAFSSLSRPWASGVGHRAGRLPPLSRSSPTLGREDGAPGLPSRAARETRSFGAACAARAGGRPGCWLRPLGLVRRARLSGGPRSPVLGAPVCRAPLLCLGARASP